MNRLLIICILTLSVASIAQAQLKVNSPYSRFGLGDIYKNESGFARSMGGISFGLRSSDFINSRNPAAYTAVDSSTFILDVGYSGLFMESQSSTATTQSNYFNLDYIKAAFPITNWWRASIGLSPYSSVSYNINSSQIVDSVGTVNTSYNGDGGINQFTFGNGFKIGKHISLGVNTSYLFGKLNYSKSSEIPDDINYYTFKLTNTIDVRNLYFDFGVQYYNSFGKKKDYNLTLGAVFSNQQNLNAYSTSFGQTFLSTSTGFQYIKDTIVDDNNGKGTITIPLYYGGGFNLQKSDKWSIGLDYAAQQWENYESFGKKDSLQNSMSINFGGSYRVGKVLFRAGGKYYNSYLKLNGQSIKELGMTFGLSIPLFIDQQTKTFPFLDLGTEIGTRGLTDNGLIKQNYAKFFLGLSIRSSWFNRPKYY